MLRDEILARLRADRPALKRFGVKSIGVFGSVARGEADADSDIDILVDYAEGTSTGLFEFLDLKEHLETLLERPVDLVTPEALHPMLRDDILKEFVHA